MRLHLVVILTRDCNMRCSYCPFPKEPKFMEPSTLDSVYDLCERSSVENVVVNFHGGEPALAWDLIKRWLERAGARGGRYLHSLCSNGTRLTREHLLRIKESGVRLRVSCDGDLTTHVAHRRSADPAKEPDHILHERTLRAIHRALTLGVDMGVNMVVTPATVSRLASNARFFRNLGLRDVMISPALALLWPRPALVELARQFRRVRTDLLSDPDFRTLLPWSRDFTLRKWAEARYFSGAGPGAVWPLKRMVDYDGGVYADEDLFDEWTHAQLRVGHVNDLPSFTAGRECRTDFFNLVYKNHTFGKPVTWGMKRAQQILAQHYAELGLALSGTRRPSPPREAMDFAAAVTS